MLNNDTRNRAYKRALENWAINNKDRGICLDIGTGTGLLAVYAHQAGIPKVFACDRNETMFGIAQNVLKANNLDKDIKLIQKLSNDLVVGRDIPEKCDLIVTEIMDSGVLGEGILQSLIHAKKYLLKEKGQIIPWKAKVFISGYQSRILTQNHVLINESFKEYIFLDGLNLIQEQNEPYDCENVDNVPDFKIITNTNEDLEINFNDLETMKDYYSGQLTCKIKLQSEFLGEQDCLDGFVVWFKLYLDPKNPENSINTSPGENSCWNQAIFPLKHPVILKKYQVINLNVSCKEGILKLESNLEENLKYLEIDEKVLKFLNDSDYLRDMENSVLDSVKKCKKIDYCADFSPFPYVGFVLLKEKRLKKLYCKNAHERLIKKIASFNCIDTSSIIFVDNPLDLLELTEIRFDIIILFPFDTLGDLDNQVIYEIGCLRSAMKPSSPLIPHKIEIHSKLISSDWLFNCCQITDPGIRELKIDQFLKHFETEHHLDLQDFTYMRVSDEFKLADISFTDELRENSVKVPLKNTLFDLHAVLSHFKIQFTKKSEIHETNSRDSHIRQFAFILNRPIKFEDQENTNLRVCFKQNFGIFKCFVEK
jgi:predicted RNA methylase